MISDFYKIIYIKLYWKGYIISYSIMINLIILIINYQFSNFIFLMINKDFLCRFSELKVRFWIEIKVIWFDSIWNHYLENWIWQKHFYKILQIFSKVCSNSALDLNYWIAWKQFLFIAFQKIQNINILPKILYIIIIILLIIY